MFSFAKRKLSKLHKFPRRQRKAFQRRLTLETLESRRLLSVTGQRLADTDIQTLQVAPLDIVDVTGLALPPNVHFGDPQSPVTPGPFQVKTDDAVYFLGYDTSGPVGQSGLYKSDGTAGGTILLKQFLTLDTDNNSLPRHVGSLTNVSGILYFFVYNDGSDPGLFGAALWKSDGTSSGTLLVKDGFDADVFEPRGPNSVTASNGTLFFTCLGGDNGLWKSDGTEAGTVRVHNVGVGLSSELTDVNGTLFFTGADLINGLELWKSDGTTAGTTLVKDIRSGSAHSFPLRFTQVDATVFFTADDGTHGVELWKTDGTAAGTVLVRDIRPGSASSLPQNLTAVNGTLFLSADDGINGRELWKSDGTGLGTVLVSDIRAGSFGSDPQNLTNVEGSLFFAANNGIGMELWKSDGTPGGTTLIQDIWVGPGSSNPSILTNANGTLFFRANDGVHGVEPWLLVATPIVVPVDIDTINSDLQQAVANIQSTTVGSGAPPANVAISATSVDITSVVAAINQVEPDPDGPVVQLVAEVPIENDAELDNVILAANSAAPETNGLAVVIVVDMASGNYSIGQIDLAPGVTLVLNGIGGSITFVGSSPALIVNSGDVVATGVTFENSTDASTILVTGGSLVLRDSIVRETTGGSHAAIEITGGSVDLGTAANPGGNTFEVLGAGEFITNTSGAEVPVFGNTFLIDSTSITADFIVGPLQRLIFDTASGEIALAPAIIDVGIEFGNLNLNIEQNGSLSLVILGSSLFDVSQVQAGSLKLAGVAIDVFNQKVQDTNEDGRADLRIHFHTSQALKAALTDIYSDVLLDDYADDQHYATKQDALISLDGAFGALGQEFHGTDSATVFLAGKSLKALLNSLGI